MQKLKEKNSSFIRTIASAVLLYMILMIIILSAIWWNTRITLESAAGATLLQAKEISDYEIEEVLKANEQALAVVLQDNADISAFKNGTDVQKAIAQQNMLQTLKNIASSSTDVETIFFYDLIGNNYIAKTANGLNYNDTVMIRQSIEEMIQEYPGNMPSKWIYRQIGEKKYLLRLYKNKNRMLGALVNISGILERLITNDSVCYAITDINNDIIVQTDNGEITSSDLSFKVSSGASWSDNGKYLVLGGSSTKGDFGIFVALEKHRVYGNYQTIQLIIILLVVSAIVLLGVITLYTRRVVYAPLRELLIAMKKIENGEQSLRLPDKADTVEFRQINNSFNQMIDTIVNLRMRSYEERIQFDEATLKYVQLQIKPHFFLNALTTIHSMSYQDRNEEIRDYIERLSRNVRYLFKSGMHTVPLTEEIEHIKDYIAMQEILYPGCVFDFIDIDERILDYPVPQLLIHTILENIYKHTVSVDNLTSILISCKLEERNGEEMCHIVVEDDGVGFPSEFLLQVKNGNVTVKENGHGIGLWNLKKTLSLMYRRDDLIEFSNKEPHGSKVDMWIPKRVKRQSSVWKLS